MENIAVVVEEWPPAPLEAGRGRDDGPLLGIYQGTPLGDRSSSYHLIPPDRITLYRGPILALCRTRAEVIREIRDTVVHEIGHFFGLAEDELP
jgi:predicted Zn-dependent protease with MMP-like domain